MKTSKFKFIFLGFCFLFLARSLAEAQVVSPTQLYQDAINKINDYNTSAQKPNHDTPTYFQNAVNAVMRLQPYNNIKGSKGKGLWDDALSYLTQVVNNDLQKTHVISSLKLPQDAGPNFGASVVFNNARIFVSDLHHIYEYGFNPTKLSWDLIGQISPQPLNAKGQFAETFDVKYSLLVAVNRKSKNNARLIVFYETTPGSWVQAQSFDLTAFDPLIKTIHLAVSWNDFYLYSLVVGLSGSKGQQYMIYDQNINNNRLSWFLQKRVSLKGNFVSVATNGDYIIIGHQDKVSIFKAKSTIINNSNSSVRWYLQKEIVNHKGYLSQTMVESARLDWNSAKTWWVRNNHWASLVEGSRDEMVLKPSKHIHQMIKAMIETVLQANPNAGINKKLLERILWSAALGLPEYGENFGQSVGVYEMPVLQIALSGYPSLFGDVTFAIGSPSKYYDDFKTPSAVFTIVKNVFSNQQTDTWQATPLQTVFIMGEPSLDAGYNLSIGQDLLMFSAREKNASSAKVMAYGLGNTTGNTGWLFTYNTALDSSIYVGDKSIPGDTPMLIGSHHLDRNTSDKGQVVVIQ